MGSGQWQGTEGFKKGNLKRQLESVAIVRFDGNHGGDSEASDVVAQLWLTGLNGNLKVMVACGVQSQDYSSQPFPWVAGGGTIQLYPCTKFGDALKIFLRPVFQDPSISPPDNSNHPLPEELPYGWEVQFTEADQVMIEVTIAASQWAAANVSGEVTVQVAVEYNGAWWDISAIEYVMGQVQLQGAGDVPTIGTAGE
jgi:hypothetical protein